MAGFLRRYGPRLTTAVACPVLALLGVISGIVGELTNSRLVLTVAEALFATAWTLLLPTGLLCLIFSRRLALQSSPSGESQAVEFILGAAGVMFVVLAVIMSSAFWLSVSQLLERV